MPLQACPVTLGDWVSVVEEKGENRQNPDHRSGFQGITPAAEIMPAMSRKWGVEPQNVIVESESRDTKDHPLFVQSGGRFLCKEEGGCWSGQGALKPGICELVLWEGCEIYLADSGSLNRGRI